MAAPTAPKFDILHPRQMDPGATSNWMNNPTQLLRAKPLFLDGKFWVNLGLVGPWVCLVCHFYGAMNWRISYPATCLSGQRHIQDGQLTAMDRANPRSPAVIRFRPPVRSYPEQPSYPEQLPLPGAPSSFNWPPSSQLSPTTLSPTSPAAASSPAKPSRLLGSPVSSGWQPTLAPVGFRPRPTPGCLWQRPVPTAPQHEDPPPAPPESDGSESGAEAPEEASVTWWNHPVGTWDTSNLGLLCGITIVN